MAINQKALDTYGENILRHDNGLFYKIPSLIKYYFPSIIKHLNFAKISGKRQKVEKVNIDDGNLIEEVA
jgi:hypothetical protein